MRSVEVRDRDGHAVSTEHLGIRACEWARGTALARTNTFTTPDRAGAFVRHWAIAIAGDNPRERLERLCAAHRRTFGVDIPLAARIMLRTLLLDYYTVSIESPRRFLPAPILDARPMPAVTIIRHKHWASRKAESSR